LVQLFDSVLFEKVGVVKNAVWNWAFWKNWLFGTNC